jgi:dissimilatory sulfite reductase (desulfoviridin) alpha/beta subunit
MAVQNIDYDALKKRGFLRQKQDGFFVLRTKMPYGVFEAKHIAKLIQISCEYAQGFIHTTVRQGIEIPFIKFESVDKVEQELKVAGIETGTSGSRLRTTTCCPGNNWCKSGLINTFALYKRIEEELNIRCGIDLPHKFKIAISGCPNGCTRPQNSEIGIHGQVDLASPTKRIGYAVYLGGCSGRTPRAAFKLDKVFTENEVLELIAKVVTFFKNNAKPRQRLGLLIEEAGKEKFLQAILG